jgi:hypothetical protein
MMLMSTLVEGIRGGKRAGQRVGLGWVFGGCLMDVHVGSNTTRLEDEIESSGSVCTKKLSLRSLCLVEEMGNCKESR